MKKNSKNKEKKKLLIVIITVVIIIAIISSSTYSYWRWEILTGTGENSQQTNIKLEVPGGTLNIDGGGITAINTMYPTSDCDGSGALIGQISTVTAVNGSEETDMTVYLAIRASLSASHGTLTSADKTYLKWAIVDTSTSDTCDSPTATGTFANVTNATDIDTGISFTVPSLSTTEKKYRIYVWLDSSYTFINYGNNVSDPMQDLSIVVGWSPDSIMAQDENYTFIP